MMKSKHLVASFLYPHADILIKIVFDAEPRPDIPVIYIRIKRTDMVYVLQVKVESALAHVAPRYAVSADELELEYKGRRLKETRALDFYSITEGSEVVASFCAVPSEQEAVVAQPEYAYLDKLVQATPGVPSSGMVKSIISQFGFHCQVCWRRRWFRCEVLRVYPTSLLVAYLDWTEAEWPHFFLRINLPSNAREPPLPGDELWRVRWHKTLALSQLPVVDPFFSALPPILWLRAVLRVYALADEKQMLQEEVHDRLPAKAAAVAGARRHVVVLLGDCGVGKTKLIETLCAGPPDPGVLEGLEAPTAGAPSGGGGAGGGAGGGDGGGDGGGGTRREQRTWPTVAPKCYHTEVAMPHGAAPAQLEVWDTSGRDRFKSLALTFYRRAHSVLLVFDVKNRDSFENLGAVGGWRDEFTRMTGASPHSFPFMLVGNKAEDDLAAERRVYEEDVRDWCHGEGDVMPYLETSFVGNAADSYKAAQRVFRTLVLAEASTKSNFGRYRPPDTVRVAEEEEEAAGGLQAVDKALRSLGRRGSQVLQMQATGLKGNMDALLSQGRRRSAALVSGSLWSSGTGTADAPLEQPDAQGAEGFGSSPLRDTPLKKW